MPKPAGRGRCAAVRAGRRRCGTARSSPCASVPGGSRWSTSNRQHRGKPSAETERLSVDILNGGANDYNPAAHLAVGTSSAPLDDTRTRFNRSHMAGLNNLRKLSEDYQLSSSLTWGYDRLASDRAARQSWYLADGTRVDTEQESAASCRQQLSARIALKANTERFYMPEKLETAGMERPPCRAFGQLPQPPACRGPRPTASKTT